MKKLKQELMRSEGIRNRAYMDSEGIWTIGVGWNLEEWGLPKGAVFGTGEQGPFRKLLTGMAPRQAVALAWKGLFITDDSINALLSRSIWRALDDARYVIPDFEGLTGARQRVFIRMAFNLGRKRLGGFKKMIAAVEAGDWPEVSAQMVDSKWARQVGARARRLAAEVV